MEQLQVVNHEKLDGVLLLHAPGPGAQLQNREAGGIIDEQGRVGKLAGGVSQQRKIALDQEAFANVAEVDASAGAQHAENERFSGHFQAENPDGEFFVHRDVIGDVHGERGFAKAGPGGDDDHFTGMEATGHFVQIGEASTDAGQFTLAGMEILDGVDGLLDQFLDGEGVYLDAGLTDVENFAFDLVHGGIDFAFMIVKAGDNFSAGADHFSQQIFLLHDLEVISKVGGGGDHVRERGEVAEAASLIEKLLGFEPLLEGDEVDRFAMIVHFLERAEDGLVAQVIEDFGANFEFLDRFAHAVIGR